MKKVPFVTLDKLQEITAQFTNKEDSSIGNDIF